MVRRRPQLVRPAGFRGQWWALAAALALCACAGEVNDGLEVISVSRVTADAPIAPAAPASDPVAMTPTRAPDQEPPPGATAAPAGPRAHTECTAVEKLRCKKQIGNLDICRRCGAPPSCGDRVCAEDETDATCGVDCGCAAEGRACGSVAPFGCYCDSSCGATGDCCADAELVCRPAGSTLAALAAGRR